MQKYEFFIIKRSVSNWLLHSSIKIQLLTALGIEFLKNKQSKMKAELKVSYFVK